jgi:hypothetical protein
MFMMALGEIWLLRMKALSEASSLDASLRAQRKGFRPIYTRNP